MKTMGRGSKAGLRIERRFTAEKEDAYSGVEWTTRTSRITNPDGTVVFEMADAEVPAEWSQVASDIMVSKYFAKPACLNTMNQEIRFWTSRASPFSVPSDRHDR
jgi:hypothetical protein